MKQLVRLILTSCLIFALAGCASGPNNVRTVHTNTATYSNQSCEELELALAETLSEISQQHSRMTNESSDDITQLTVATLFLWPVAFALEGSNSDDQEEYGVLKGEAIAMRNVSFDKNCEFTNPPQKRS